jgi:hypothetical protein
VQDHADSAAAEHTAAEALQAERARCSELQSKLAELTASSAEQQRSLKAQLTEMEQQLAVKIEEAASLHVQLLQAQEGLASRDADIARLQGELLQVGSSRGRKAVTHRGVNCCAVLRTRTTQQLRCKCMRKHGRQVLEGLGHCTALVLRIVRYMYC